MTDVAEPTPDAEAAPQPTEWDGVPGLAGVKVEHGETTLVVDVSQLVEAAEHLRDAEGFNFLADVTAVDYLGWGSKGVAGYIGTTTGRDINHPATQGLQTLPQIKPRRFAVNYHLLQVQPGSPARRIRMQVWVDDDEEVPTVIYVWPTADWHEREAWDMMGIRFAGHPNLVRILMDEDWDGHPLRKDYPIGGEPVRFSGEE